VPYSFTGKLAATYSTLALGADRRAEAEFIWTKSCMEPRRVWSISYGFHDDMRQQTLAIESDLQIGKWCGTLEAVSVGLQCAMRNKLFIVVNPFLCRLSQVPFLQANVAQKSVTWPQFTSSTEGTTRVRELLRELHIAHLRKCHGSRCFMFHPASSDCRTKAGVDV
jgi:hypothetical protein